MVERGSLAGRVALVTGAARNLGAATALRLAEAGARVGINYSSPASAPDADQIVQAICDRGGEALAVEADVGDEASVARMVARLSHELGAVDTVVNNAAMSVAGARPWNALDVQDWDDVFRVNVTGGHLILREIDRVSGIDNSCVVNISSIRIATGKAGNVHYTASKAAQIGVTRVLARELGPRRVRVNALLVGAIRTPAEAEYGAAEEVDREVLAQQALPFRGEPEHIADAVHFLVSDAASFITGQTLAVDGGWVLH